MSHFIPTAFDRGAAALIGMPGAAVERPVSSANPLVATSIVQARQGVLIPLTNWSGGPVKGLQVTVNIDVPTKDVKLASGQPVQVSGVAGKQIFTFDLDVADALILR